MKENIEMTDRQSLAELFSARAESVAAKVTRAADAAAAKAMIEDLKARCGSDQVGVAQAALGIAETGTCVVETDDEETRLATMLPENSVLILRIPDIVESLAETAPYLRERQKDGKISYTSFITGPSRTADIERVGAIGVHGPLNVHIILLEN
jgi:L-lactate dehydrogenase complex protein LldG